MYSKVQMAALASDIGCIKAATEILGDKWTPLLLRLFVNNEVVRFCQLQDMVGSINPRTLSARLTRLEEHGIIQKLPSKNSRCEYVLTEKGQDLLPVLKSMETWSAKHPA